MIEVPLPRHVRDGQNRRARVYPRIDASYYHSAHVSAADIWHLRVTLAGSRSSAKPCRPHVSTQDTQIVLIYARASSFDH